MPKIPYTHYATSGVYIGERKVTDAEAIEYWKSESEMWERKYKEMRRAHRAAASLLNELAEEGE